jgi:hypothetical protein
MDLVGSGKLNDMQVKPRAAMDALSVVSPQSWLRTGKLVICHAVACQLEHDWKEASGAGNRASSLKVEALGRSSLDNALLSVLPLDIAAHFCSKGYQGAFVHILDAASKEYGLRGACGAPYAPKQRALQ